MRPATRIMVAVLLAALTGGSAAEAEPLRLTAYVNVSSGCQKPTEQLLQDLAKKYAGRLVLELIDFGQPAGRKRWKADGLHCMTILLDGSEKAEVVLKGASLQVAFQMPPGYAWLLEELDAAVRQRLDGVSAADREGAAISAKTDAAGAHVLAAGEAILDAASPLDAERVCAQLRAAAALKPLTQDDFAFAVLEGSAKVTLRGAALLDLGPVEGPVPADAGAQAEARFARLIGPFPRVSRPFPGQARPQGGG